MEICRCRNFQEQSPANIYLFEVNKRKTIDVVDVVLNGLVFKSLDSQSKGPCSKSLGGSKVDLVFHPSEVDKMSTGNLVVKSKHYVSTKIFQKQPFADVLQNRCSYKFCKIHKKRSTPLPMLFFCEFFIFFPFLQNTSGRLLLKFVEYLFL